MIHTVRAYIAPDRIRFEEESGDFRLKGADYFLASCEEITEATRREAEVGALKIAFRDKGVDVDTLLLEWDDDTRPPTAGQIEEAKKEEW